MSYEIKEYHVRNLGEFRKSRTGRFAKIEGLVRTVLLELSIISLYQWSQCHRYNGLIQLAIHVGTNKNVMHTCTWT